MLNGTIVNCVLSNILFSYKGYIMRSVHKELASGSKLQLLVYCRVLGIVSGDALSPPLSTKAPYPRF